MQLPPFGTFFLSFSGCSGVNFLCFSFWPGRYVSRKINLPPCASPASDRAFFHVPSPFGDHQMKKIQPSPPPSPLPISIPKPFAFSSPAHFETQTCPFSTILFNVYPTSPPPSKAPRTLFSTHAHPPPPLHPPPHCHTFFPLPVLFFLQDRPLVSLSFLISFRVI